MSVFNVAKSPAEFSAVPNRADEAGLVGIHDAARALHLSVSGVRYLVKEGQLACERISRRRVFQPDDVVELAHQRAHATLVPPPAPSTPKKRGAPRQLRLRLFRTEGRKVTVDRCSETSGDH